MTQAEQVINEIKERADNGQFIEARFGDNWREHIKGQLERGEIDIDMIINLAWKQGRRVVMFERFVESLHQ